VNLIAADVNPYGWFNEAEEALDRGRADAPLLSEIAMPLSLDARPFSLPPYEMSDPPYKGYLFESDPAVTGLDEYHQPFPVIALQFPILDTDRRVPTVAIVSHDEQKQELLIVQANKLHGHSDWTWAPVGLNVRVNGPLDLNKLAIRPQVFGNRPISHEYVQTLVNGMHPAVMAAYELAVLIQCQNISIRHVKAPEKVNEKRKRKGKRPLPDGYIICVARDVTRSEYDGDGDDDAKREHASPRTHFRRGHIRRFKSGDKIWVSPTIVNPGSTPLDSKYQILF
jgi:hypothetical protein